jgi:hypothetical protein
MINVWMFAIGMFFVMLGAGTSDANLETYSFSVGITLGAVGIVIIFFSFEENRNLKILRRKAKCFWHNLKNGNIVECFF